MAEGRTTRDPPEEARAWGLLAGLFVAYVLFGVVTLRPEWLGSDLALDRVIWMSSGVALAGVLRLGLVVVPVVALAEFLLTVVTGSPVALGVGTAAGNSLEIVLAWGLLRWVDASPELRRWSDVVALVGLAAGVAALLGAAVSTLALVAFTPTPGSEYARIGVLWWLTHANGMILGAPFLLAMGDRRNRWSPWRRVEAVAIALGLSLLGTVVFLTNSPEDIGRRLLYAPFPLLLWAAFRFGLPGAASANLLVSTIAMLATAAGVGPFVAATDNQSLFQLWIFVAVNAITALLVAGMVEERRRTARALARSEAHVRSVVEATADALLAVDVDGRISFANRSFLTLWGASGGGVPEGRLDEDEHRVQRLIGSDEESLSALLASHRTVLDEVTLEDDTVFERYSAPLVRDGRVTGRIWSFRDLSERRKSEEERQRFEQQVQHAQKLESLGVLAGGIAHDFNNLLVAIMGNADLAETALEGGHPARDPLEEVIRASQRAADLCQQMLAYAGKGRVAVGPVDLNEIVDEMGELMGVSISKGALLRIDLTAGLPPVKADVVQLRQVVLNLLTNASDALEGGQGEIRMSTYRATASLFDETAAVLDERPSQESLVAVEVRDTGVGMDEETRARIFEPFFSTKARGRGLGLAAVLGIVRGHRGTLELWSEPGAGTRVRVLLPSLDPRTTHAGPAPEPLDPPIPEGRLEGRVLVVDDEEPVRRVAGRMLLAAGLDVVEAGDGREALERYRELGGEVDVVLLDLTMPRMGGAETARELRRLDPDLRIILSTGYSDLAASTAGAAELPLLRKPYRRGALLARVREALEG